MGKIWDRAFAVVLGVFFSGALLCWAAVSAGVTLPEALDPETARYLSGGFTEAHLQENLSPQAFADKTFQTAFETEIDNNIPAKATALLGNSAAQRSIIQVANIPFGFPCYHTFYQSSYVYYPAYDSIVKIPVIIKKKRQEQARTFFEGVFEAAKQHPDKRFVVYMPQITTLIDINPTLELMSNRETYDHLFSKLTDTLDKKPDNVFVMTHEYDSFDDYYQDFYRSDHHWNLNGTARAYNEIASAIGLPAFTQATDARGFGDLLYTGSYGRTGLMLLRENVTDSKMESGLSVRTPEGETVPDNHALFNDDTTLHRTFQFYDLYYCDIDTKSVWLNENASTDRTAMLISDSYGGSMQRLLANNYREMAMMRDLYASFEVPESTSFNDYLEKYDPDDVFLVAHLGNVAEIIERCPTYFE